MIQRHFEAIETNGVTLRTVVEGDGPLVILLHGFPQCWYLWRNQIDPLVEAGYRVAVPDQRGYGGSSAPAAISDYDIRKLAGDVAGLAHALGEERFAVVGHDFGALVAWHAALLHESACTAVLGMGVPYFRSLDPRSFIHPPGADGRFWYMRYFQEPGVAEAELESDPARFLVSMYWAESADAPPGTWMRQLEHDASSKMVDAVGLPERWPPWLTQEDLAYYVEQFRRSGFRGPLNWYRNIARITEITPELETKRFRQPSAFVAGAADPVPTYAPNWRELMQPWFEDLRFIALVPEAGHWVQLEKPRETTRLILEFLEGL